MQTLYITLPLVAIDTIVENDITDVTCESSYKT